jgi:hypothetical protein
MGGGSAPGTPDYVGAANAQGEANLKAARATGQMNNPNVNNPYGKQSVTWNGDTATINQTLSPEQQKLYESGLIGKNTNLQTGNSLAKNSQMALSKPVDFSGLPAAPTSANKTRQDVVDSMMSRVNTDTTGQRDAANSQLIAQGIRPGTAAYSTAMTQIDRQYNDARQQAINAGTSAASQDYSQNMGTHQQAISDMLAQRDTSLNEMNALQGGTQVSNPFAGNLGFQGGASVQAAPIANAVGQQGQAAQNMYNVQQASQNGNISAGAGMLGSLGQAAATYYK